MPRRLCIAIVVLLSCALAASSGSPASAQSVTGCMGDGPRSKVSTRGTMEIGPGDVVELKSDVDGTVIQIGFVRPKAPDGYRSPVIVQASPYLSHDLRDVDLRECNQFLVDNYVPHGYTIAFVPTRGAGGTDSCADLMGPKERADLDQAVDWLGSQPWSNGNVGMIGLSYDGSTPWEVASMGNPHLKTIVPESGVHNLFDLVYLRGRFDWRWWLFVPGYYHYYGHGHSNPLFGRDADRYARSTMCETTDEGLTATVESYTTGEYDSLDYWRKRNMDPNILRRYRGSVFLVQGLQDWNVDPGHQYPFISELERRGTVVKHLLGQWDHAHPDGNEVGRREDFAEILLGWWERWLKGRGSVDVGPQVEVQDSDLRWRTETGWPPQDARRQKLYLSADNVLSNSPETGRATALLGPGTRNRYFFLSSSAEVYNDTPIDHFCVDCATFTYEIRQDELRLVGLPQLRLKVTPSGPSGFVAAYLFRIDRDGGWHKLGWGATDLRFPKDGREAHAVTPGEEIDVQLPFQPLDGVAHRGEKLLLLLDQGHADHMPGVPYFPVELRYGGKLGTFAFDTTAPSRDDFFTPPDPGEGES